MKATTPKSPAKSRSSTSRSKSKAVEEKRDDLIQPWAVKSAISVINALSSVKVTKLPKPIGSKS